MDGFGKPASGTRDYVNYTNEINGQMISCDLSQALSTAALIFYGDDEGPCHLRSIETPD